MALPAGRSCNTTNNSHKEGAPATTLVHGFLRRSWTLGLRTLGNTTRPKMVSMTSALGAPLYLIAQELFKWMYRSCSEVRLSSTILALRVLISIDMDPLRIGTDNVDRLLA